MPSESLGCSREPPKPPPNSTHFPRKVFSRPTDPTRDTSIGWKGQPPNFGQSRFDPSTMMKALLIGKAIRDKKQKSKLKREIEKLNSEAEERERKQQQAIQREVQKLTSEVHEQAEQQRQALQRELTRLTSQVQQQVKAPPPQPQHRPQPRQRAVEAKVGDLTTEEKKLLLRLQLELRRGKEQSLPAPIAPIIPRISWPHQSRPKEEEVVMMKSPTQQLEVSHSEDNWFHRPGYGITHGDVGPTGLETKEEVVMMPSPSAPVSEKNKEPQAKECCICLVAPSCMAFLPCGHLCACGPCSQLFLKKECPICRQAIAAAVPIFLS